LIIVRWEVALDLRLHELKMIATGDQDNYSIKTSQLLTNLIETYILDPENLSREQRFVMLVRVLEMNAELDLPANGLETYVRNYIDQITHRTSGGEGGDEVNDDHHTSFRGRLTGERTACWRGLMVVSLLAEALLVLGGGE